MKNYLLLVFVLGWFSGFSQVPNDSLEYRIRPDTIRTGQLQLSINNFNYLRNYEFFNKIQDGYTLYGAQLEPQLIYYAHPQLALIAGVHLRKDFGDVGINRTIPLFSIKYQKNQTAFITGALEGNISHRFIDPLYDVERKITEPIEYGTQFIVNKPGVFLDAFINWKKMIYKPSLDQEQIVAGLSTDITVFRNANMKFSIPLQAVVFHQGGQIDVVDKPLQTLINTALGFKLSLKRTGLVNEIYTNNYWATYNESSPTKAQPFPHGGGIFLNAGLSSEYGSLSSSYWKANQFIAPNGMPLYQSVSQQIDNAGFVQKQRELLFFRYAYQKELVPSFFLDLRLEPVLDLGLPAKKFEIFHSLFVTYKRQFTLIKPHSSF